MQKGVGSELLAGDVKRTLLVLIVLSEWYIDDTFSLSGRSGAIRGLFHTPLLVSEGVCLDKLNWSWVMLFGGTQFITPLLWFLRLKSHTCDTFLFSTLRTHLNDVPDNTAVVIVERFVERVEGTPLVYSRTLVRQWIHTFHIS